MLLIIILFALAVGWFIANNRYKQTQLWRYKRMRTAVVWAFIGAIIGSSFGVAGFGTAIAGTIPGALVGYLAASNLMKMDENPNQ
jgi:uncharacterized protein YcfJ